MIDQAHGPTLTRKEALWLTCQPKTCCYATVVVPSGRDVWRIARTLDAPPWSFLVYFRSPQPRRDAFLLDPAGPPLRLALAKRPGRRTKTPPPCTFLLRARDGVHRCGLGALRPLVCRTFPAELADGVLCLDPGLTCTCRRWALADVDLAEERALLAIRQAEAEEYWAVVADWNARVAAAPAGGCPDFFDYCAFLLAAYDALATGAVAEDAS